MEDAGTSDGSIFLPVGLETLRLYDRPGTGLWSHALLRSDLSANGAANIQGDVVLCDEDGRVVLEALGFSLQRLGQDSALGKEPDLDDWLYEIEWQLKARSVKDRVRRRPLQTRRRTGSFSWMRPALVGPCALSSKRPGTPASSSRPAIASAAQTGTLRDRPVPSGRVQAADRGDIGSESAVVQRRRPLVGRGRVAVRRGDTELHRSDRDPRLHERSQSGPGAGRSGARARPAALARHSGRSGRG